MRVSLGGGAPEDTMARVLELVSPTVAVMTVAEKGRSGSGVVVHEAGFIITNAHVVRGVRTLTVSFENGLDLEGEVYGVDRRTDLAVVKVEHTEPLAAATLGDSDSLQVGEFVLALGAPFGLRATATSGIISGLHKRGLGIARYEDFIVTDAPINRGNSGGPLVNLRGEVIGINTAIIVGDENDPGRGGGFSGIGFAIPMNLVKVIAQRLIGDGGLKVDAEEALGASEGTAALVPGGRAVLTGLTATPLRGGQSAADAVGFVRVLDATGNVVRTGSVFVVDSEIGQLLITNQHVTAGETVAEVDFPGHFGIPGSVIYERRSFGPGDHPAYGAFGDPRAQARCFCRSCGPRCHQGARRPRPGRRCRTRWRGDGAQCWRHARRPGHSLDRNERRDGPGRLRRTVTR